MKTAKDLILAYINGTAEQSGSLFVAGGTLELPYLASIGLPAILSRPKAITTFLEFLHNTLYPGFRFQEVKIHIDTSTQVFAEYHINQGRILSNRCFRIWMGVNKIADATYGKSSLADFCGGSPGESILLQKRHEGVKQKTLAYD
jgi:hypothetical protein